MWGKNMPGKQQKSTYYPNGDRSHIKVDANPRLFSLLINLSNFS